MRGTVAVGAVADQVVVGGDPLRDISLLLGQGEYIRVVLNGGARAKTDARLHEAM